nr:MAG TPA: hypothetical protein [Caudoviricetes sp.]DAO83828.1 MAG TPA: hypothetical protein [Caudoviricetes sp.]
MMGTFYLPNSRHLKLRVFGASLMEYITRCTAMRMSYNYD